MRKEQPKRIQRLKAQLLDATDAAEWRTVSQISTIIRQANEGLVGRYLVQMVEDGELEKVIQPSSFGRMAGHYRHAQKATGETP